MTARKLSLDDLPVLVSRIIDHAAARRDLVRLDTDPNLLTGPHPRAAEYQRWAATQRQGILAFASDQESPNFVAIPEDLDAYDHVAQPRVSTRAAFEAMRAAYCPANMNAEEYLGRVVDHRHGPRAVPEQDREARAFAAVHFAQQHMLASPRDVQVFSGGVEGLFMSFTSALLSTQPQRTSAHAVLAPVGLNKSWASIHSGAITFVDDLTGHVLADWLARTSGPRGLYLPLVNSLTGQVLDRSRAYEIAAVVLQHNHRHPDGPVFVFADDCAVDSYHSPAVADTARCPSSITGVDLGDSALGPMTRWSVSVVAPAKQFGLAASRVAFALTHNRWLANALNAWSAAFAHTSVSSIDEIVATAALCLTPSQAIKQWNAGIVRNLDLLSRELVHLNREIGFNAYTLGSQTGGGHHALLLVDQRLFPTPAINGVDAATALLHYGRDQRTSGIAVVPAELFGGGPVSSRLALRANIAISDETLAELIRRLRAAASALRGPDGHQVMAYARELAHDMAGTGITAEDPHNRR